MLWGEVIVPPWEGVYRSSSEEKRLIKSHPENAQTSIHLAYLAGSVTALFFLPRNYHNNNGDAFRHCFWSSLIAKEISAEWALLWTMAHEMNASPSNRYRQMDEFNNAQGIQILKSNPPLSTVSLIRRCLELVENGSGADGLSPLMRCSLLRHGHKYARALLDRGANANYQNPFNGETTLMLAAKHRNVEMVDVLLPVANKDLRSFSGLKAYEMAMNEGNMDIAKRLL